MDEPETKPPRLFAETDRLEELIDRLLDIGKEGDPEKAHGDADEALLIYINDERVRGAYELIKKWYA